MQREPDWEALSELNFLLSHRITEPLNAALSAIELSEMSESAGKPAEWWRDRARHQIASVLNLFTAWSWLVQYKTGMKFPEKAIREFSLQSLLDWVTIQLQIVPPLKTPKDVMIHANQETLQEGILLLYSVASTQGTGAKIVVDLATAKVTFRIRYARLRQSEPMPTLDTLITSFGQHWRMQVTAFELKIARDFLHINQCPLDLNDDGHVIEFCFTAPVVSERVAVNPAQQLRHKIVTKIQHATLPHTFPATVSYLPNLPTQSLEGKNGFDPEKWHLPDEKFRIALQEKPTQPAPLVINTQPTREGGWHSPTTRLKRTTSIPAEAISTSEMTDSKPTIISLKLPEVEPPERLQTRWNPDVALALPKKKDQIVVQSESDGAHGTPAPVAPSIAEVASSPIQEDKSIPTAS